MCEFVSWINFSQRGKPTHRYYLENEFCWYTNTCRLATPAEIEVGHSLEEQS